MNNKRVIWYLIFMVSFARLLASCGEGGEAAQTKVCYPACRDGYICDTIAGMCVSVCNPPCTAGEVCDGTRRVCVAPTDSGADNATGGVGGQAGKDASGGDGQAGALAGSGGQGGGASGFDGSAGSLAGSSGNGGASGLAGESGNAGSGSDAGSGGTAGSSGSAGNAGALAGSGGVGGAGHAGNGSDSGSSGVAGADASAGNSGTDGGASAGGTGGTSGVGGSAGAPICQNGSTKQCGPATDVGECQFGTATCTNGNWGQCIGAVYPSTEKCNYKDDDCDGTIDNGTLVLNGLVTVPQAESNSDFPSLGVYSSGLIELSYMKRVSPSRTEVYSGGRELDGSKSGQVFPDILINPRSAVADDWAREVARPLLDTSSGTCLWGALVSRVNGKQRLYIMRPCDHAPADPVMDSSSDNGDHPAAAYKGPGTSSFAFVFEKGSPPDIHISHWLDTAKIGGVQVSATSTASTSPAVAWDGTRWAVAWLEQVNASTTEWRYATVHENGNSVLSNGALLVQGDSLVLVSAPSGVTAISIAQFEVNLVRYTAGFANRIGETISTFGGGVNGPLAAIWNGASYGIAYSAGKPGEIYFVEASANGVLTLPVKLSATAENSANPALVWSGTDWIAAWGDGPPDSRKLMLAHVKKSCP